MTKQEVLDSIFKEKIISSKTPYDYYRQNRDKYVSGIDPYIVGDNSSNFEVILRANTINIFNHQYRDILIAAVQAGKMSLSEFLKEIK